MKRAIVLLEFHHVEFEEVEEVVCVTQRAYERVLSKLCDNEFPEQIVTKLPSNQIQVRFGLNGTPFDFAQINPNGNQTLRDFLPKPPVDIVVQDIRDLWYFKTSYSHTNNNDIFATPDGEMYAQTSSLFPGDNHILGFLELARCVFARQLLHLYQPNKSIITRRTLYIRGGGQHGTITWGALSAVLRQSEQNPFERFAGDSFGSALAVIAAIDASGGGRLYYDRMIEVCHRMKLDESDRPLDREAALDFAKYSLNEYVDKTLGELDLPVDILVTSIETGMELAVWNAETKPDVTLGDALVASMSIPAFIGAHSGCFDGGITAYEYTDRLGENSVVITLGCVVDLSKFQLLGTTGDVAREIVANWRLFSGFEKVRSVHGSKQIFLTVRDPSLSIWGGSVGTTSWHVLNYQHGFDEAIAQI